MIWNYGSWGGFPWMWIIPLIFLIVMLLFLFRGGDWPMCGGRGMRDRNATTGEITAGTQSAQVKNNQQLPESAEHLPALRRLVLSALNYNALFFTAPLPRRIFPPLVNCYGGKTNYFDNHVDNAMRLLPDNSGYVRTDLSATLFLTEPEDYDGGELVIEDTYGS